MEESKHKETLKRNQKDFYNKKTEAGFKLFSVYVSKQRAEMITKLCKDKSLTKAELIEHLFEVYESRKDNFIPKTKTEKVVTLLFYKMVESKGDFVPRQAAIWINEAGYTTSNGESYTSKNSLSFYKKAYQLFCEYMQEKLSK